MAQTVRITITPELEHALNILRQSTSGTLNTTELIKLSVGEFAQIKKSQTSVSDETIPQEMDNIGLRLFYEWAKEDGTLKVNNISKKAKVEPFTPEPYVSDC